MKELSGIGKRECIIPQNVIVTNFPTIRHGGCLCRLLTKAGDICQQTYFIFKNSNRLRTKCIASYM